MELDTARAFPEIQDTPRAVLSQAARPAFTEPSKDPAQRIGKGLTRSGLFFVRPAMKTAPRAETFRKFPRLNELMAVRRVL